MEHLEMGRERTLEDIAHDIMNQSDEGVDDILETEITEGEDAEPDYGKGESPADEFESDSDDGGDYSEY